MIRFIHMSDLHFDTTGHASKTLINPDPMPLLNKVKQHCRAEDFLLITGDVTDDGDQDQFENAARVLAPFKGRTLLVPGNHDTSNGGITYSSIREQRFEERVLKPLDVNHSYRDKDIYIRPVTDGHGTNVLTVGLNSVLQTVSNGDAARGEIGAKQLGALAQCLKDPQYNGYWRLVYLHHNPVPSGEVAPGQQLNDANELVALVKGRVDVVAFGHYGGATLIATDKGLVPSLKIMDDGRPYFVNANCSAHHRMYIAIEFEGARAPAGSVKGLKATVH